MVHKTVILESISEERVEKMITYMDVNLQAKLVDSLAAVANLEFDIIEEPMPNEFESLVWIQTTGEKLFYRCKIYYNPEVAVSLYENARNVSSPKPSLAISYLKEMGNVGAGTIKKVLESESNLLSQMSIPLAFNKNMEFKFAQTYVFHHSQSFSLASKNYKLYIKHELEILDLPTTNAFYDFILAKEDSPEEDSDADDIELF
ncbi:MAG: hypothetical protein AB8G05_25705 [Oligoflexales bacterium]